MEKLESGRDGITGEVRVLLESVPDSAVVKIKGGAAQESGLPDFYFTCAALSGRSVWIEVKRPGEEPRKLQQYKLDKFRRAGAMAISITSVDELESILGYLHVLPVAKSIMPAESERNGRGRCRKTVPGPKTPMLEGLPHVRRSASFSREEVA